MKSGKFFLKENHLSLAVLSLFIFFLFSGISFGEKKESEKAISSLKDNSFILAINRPENEPYYFWLESIYKEVFARLNIKLKADYYPLKRASFFADTGVVDGEPARIYDYASSYRNLIRVEEPVFSIIVVAYTSKDFVVELKGWDSLRNKDYMVEYPRGMKICEDNLPRVVNSDRLFNVTETLQGLRKIAAGRNDIYVDDMNAAIPLLGNKEYDLNFKIRMAGVMEKVPLFMYVHKKHRKLVPLLAKTIKSLKDEGLIDKYWNETFTPQGK